MRKLYMCVILICSFSYTSYTQHWEGLDGGTESMGVVFSIFEHDNSLIAGGSFSTVGGGTIPSIITGIWNGSIWSSTPWNIQQGSPKDHVIYYNELYIGGNFTRINGNKYCNKVARLDTTGWMPLGSGVTNGEVRAMASYNGDLYVGGTFTIVDSTITARRIAKWDGNNWNALGNGFTGGFGDVFDMTVFQNQLYVGGDFSSIDGTPVSRICSWDGNTWSSLNGGTNGLVFSLFNDTTTNRLYVGGIFTQAGGVSTPTGVAYWDGNNWYPVGTNPFIPARNLYVFNGILYNGTTQSQAVNSNNDTLKYIAWFDGINWNPMSGGLDGTCHAFATFNNEMYLGGTFTYAGDSLVNGIAKWIPGSLGIGEYTEDMLPMKIMPNPAKDEVVLETNTSRTIKLQLLVTNSNGKIIHRESISGTGEIKHKVNTSQYLAGLYMFSLYESKNKLASKKVMIKK